MPFRISSGANQGRTIIVAHSAEEALRLYRALVEEGAANIELDHLELGKLSSDELVAMAAEDETTGRRLKTS